MPLSRLRRAASRGLLLGLCAAAVLGTGQLPASGSVPGPPAGAVSGTAADTTPPSEPTGLGPRNIYLNGVAGLYWTPSTDDVGVTGYEVYAWSYTGPAPDPFTRATAYITTTATEVNATVSDLTPGRPYLFYVVAVDAAGNRSTPSLLTQQRAMREPPQPSPSPGPSTPPAPYNLSAGGGLSPGYATLTWSTPSGAGTVTFLVFRRSSSDWTYAGSSTLPRTMVSIGSEPSYTFQVVALDTAGNLSNASNAATYRTPPASPTPTATPVICAVTYRTTNWAAGFTGDVTIRNTTSAAIDGWRLAFRFPTTSQRLTQGWSATWAQSGTDVSATNAAWNRTIRPGQSLRIGFTGSHSGNNPSPTSFTLNGSACTVE
ncbi:cellulose binding domain-containing protein [Sphaerisporangium aureirubrum]|uniref:Cellulose binding domain-containing protein n=1 Tax=Sphaerisporangium aureirubrum TaxID=1544736 RepID=A0ABW1NGE2_9ACTN